MRIERIDQAVLGTLGGDVLRPSVVMAILDGVLETMSPRTRAREVEETGPGIGRRYAVDHG
jgi:hypothetical protein